MKHHDFGIVFWAHLLLIMFFWFLPFLFSLWLVFLGGIFYYIEEIAVTSIFGACPLSIIQFESKDDAFYYHYLTKYLRLNLNRKKVDFFVDWFVPFVVFAIAIIWQIVLGIHPIF